MGIPDFVSAQPGIGWCETSLELGANPLELRSCTNGNAVIAGHCHCQRLPAPFCPWDVMRWRSLSVSSGLKWVVYEDYQCHIDVNDVQAISPLA